MEKNNLNLAQHTKKRSFFFALIILAGAANGLLIACFQGQEAAISIVNILCNLMAIAGIYLWVYHDAKIHNFKISTVVKYLVILVGIIGIPIYFWRSRSSKDFWFNLGGLWLFIIYSIAFDLVCRLAQFVI
ncbi:MAG: hypothetical protein AAFQ14_10205 [Cyanobacteria bacterium J06621_12]